MTLAFSKMHGLGNDFVVIDATQNAFNLNKAQMAQLGHRQFGVGFDQLLVIERSERTDCEFKYRIFNADGSEVEHCGNGARCFAKYVVDHQMTQSARIPVETKKGQMVLRVLPDGQVEVDMGPANFSPESLPFEAAQRDRYALDLPDYGTVTFGAVSMGNPHITLLVDDIETADVSGLGRALVAHSVFPNGVNVGFLQIVDQQFGRLRVFERGVGETLACGTGACAAATIARAWGLFDANCTTLELLGGRLRFAWDENDHVLMTGPATHVFDGVIDLDGLGVPSR